MPRMNRAQPLQGPVSLLPLPRPLMTGEVLDAAFRLFRAGLLRCLPYSGMAVLVLELPSLYSTFFPASGPPDGDFLGLVPVRIITWVLVTALSAALLGVITLRLQAVSQAIRPRFRVEIATVFKRWPAAVLATLGALGFPVLLFAIGELLQHALPTGAMFVVAVPLLWPMALFAVALPAFWCDGLDPLAAIAQSVRVSRRRSWRMVGVLLATTGMVGVFYALSAIIAAMLAPILGRADLFLIATVSSLLFLVVGAFGVPFVLSVLIVAYQDLKLRELERRGSVA
jgi:hypothetical protein